MVVLVCQLDRVGRKGLWYLRTVPSRVGQIVHNLDKDPGHDDITWFRLKGIGTCFISELTMIRSNQSMKPTAPSQDKFTVLATTPCGCLISFSLDECGAKLTVEASSCL